MSKHIINSIGPLHNFTKEEVAAFQHLLLEWYYAHHRTLPWRSIAKFEKDHNKRAYSVWVSEIMCQQTQVSTVIDYYNKWMSKWPTVQRLAEASLEEVNETWAGLGYYSRAKRLHEGAIKVTKSFHGNFPKSRNSIQKELPGVGRYTASAIASIASKEPVGVVDGNVFRVISRVRAIGADITSQNVIEEIWKLSDKLVDDKEPGDFNQALMELGALVCTPKNPKCNTCPVKDFCVAHTLAEKKAKLKYTKSDQKNEMITDIECVPDCTFCLKRTDWDESLGVQNFPRKSKKTLVRNKVSAVVIVRREEEGSPPLYLFIQRPKTGLLANLWEFISASVCDDSENDYCFPEHKLMTAADKALVKKKFEKSLKDDFKFPYKITKKLNFVSDVTHIFSHIRQIYKVYEVEIFDAKMEVSYPDNYQGIKWMTEDEFLLCATSTAMKKVFKAYKVSISGHNKASKEKRKLSPSTVNAVDKKQRKLSHYFGRLRNNDC